MTSNDNDEDQMNQMRMSNKDKKAKNSSIPEYFTVDCDKVYFTKKFSQKETFYNSDITLANLTNKYLIFKIYINKQKVYSTTPSTSFLDPYGSKVISIKRLEIKDLNCEGDCFMFSAYPVDSPITDVRNINI